MVKSDTSGAVTSCTYAEVLEKKAYAVGELDDTVTPLVPAIAGTYMKMNPDFSYTSPNVSNTSPGEQSAGTNGGADQGRRMVHLMPETILYSYTSSTTRPLHP